MSVLRQYKCPCCDGAIAFDATLQKMKCPYCNNEFEVDALEAYNNELNNDKEDNMNWRPASSGSWQEDEVGGLRSYVCNSCGGEIVGDATTAATSCPYCDNPVIMTQQFAGMLKPNYVIPFKIDKKTAIATLEKHYKGKKLLPKAFKKHNHIKEIKGIYVPFWLFETDADARIRYKATRLRAWSDSRYDYTETSHYAVVRSGSLGFDKVPVDGSSKMDDILMESLEPFDFSEAVDFNTAYLSGFFADKYDVDSKQSVVRANERIKRSTENAFASTVVGYSSLLPVASNIDLKNGSTAYALYPVWILNTDWKGKKYTFAINGQTGKMVGDLPMDGSAFAKWFIGLTFGIGAAVLLILKLLGMF